jgi:hypothetical protein
MKALNNLGSAGEFLIGIEELMIGQRFGLDPSVDGRCAECRNRDEQLDAEEVQAVRDLTQVRRGPLQGLLARTCRSLRRSGARP